jgi:hypothetical protein
MTFFKTALDLNNMIMQKAAYMTGPFWNISYLGSQREMGADNY